MVLGLEEPQPLLSAGAVYPTVAPHAGLLDLGPRGVVGIAVLCAQRALPEWTRLAPDDERPARAIEHAKAASGGVDQGVLDDALRAVDGARSAGTLSAAYAASVAYGCLMWAADFWHRRDVDWGPEDLAYPLQDCLIRLIVAERELGLPTQATCEWFCARVRDAALGHAIDVHGSS